MRNFSIIMPCEKARLPLLVNTLRRYSEFGFPDNTEFLLITRSIDAEFIEVDGNLRAKVIKYEWSGESFNPSMALNLGVKNALYNNIIITCPEVKPLTNVLKQLSELPEGNYVCQVFDEDASGDTSFSLVNSNFRSQDPGLYFLACFQKKDIEFINGWDENFMGLYGWEDTDFGNRFMRAGLSFQVHDNIQAVHQYHPRYGSTENYSKGQQLFEENKSKHYKCINGLKRLE